MNQHDAEAPAPDSLSRKLHDLFDEDEETSSDDSDDGTMVDPLPKRPTDPPF
jgi:hypothetical protein